MAAAEPHHILFYDYVEDIAEKRAPHRDGHLALIRRWKDEGLIAIAGALGDPPHGAAIVFRVDDPARIDEFTAEDPYIEAGLVTARRIERLAVV